MTCIHRFYAKYRVDVHIENVTLEEAAEIKALVDKLQKKRRVEAAEKAKNDAM